MDDVDLPDGRHIPEHHLLHFHHGAVGIVASNLAGDVLFERVYRYPLGRFEWEIPAGGMEDGESPIDAAKRELGEETGYLSSNHRLVYSFNPLNSVTDSIFHIVECTTDATPTLPTDGEAAELKWMTRMELLGMLTQNEIRDGLTLTALMLTGMK